MDASQLLGIRARPAPEDCPIEWRSRYDGLVAIAYMDDKAVAGISGPWSDKFALTWWERPLPQRQLELFDSLQEAKHEVELWAMRMRNGYATATSNASSDVRSTPPQLVPMLVPVAKYTLLDQIRAMLPEFVRGRPRPAPRHVVEMMRERQARQQIDVGDLHLFADR
jgi:hypothetical protein